MRRNAFQEVLDRVEARGCHLKGLDPGLVDFPHLRNGKEGLSSVGGWVKRGSATGMKLRTDLKDDNRCSQRTYDLKK